MPADSSGTALSTIQGPGALSSEDYLSFEIAKANDSVLGGDDLAKIRSYSAYTRAQAQALHKTIAAMNGVDDVAAVKAEAIETQHTFAKVSVYADQRIGEILRELPKAKGNQYQQSANSPTGEEAPTKAQALEDAGIGRKTAYDLQAMAANPEVVQAVIDKAEEEGTVVSRSKVLKAIKAAREHERNAMQDELDDALQAQEDAEVEVTMLKQRIESFEMAEPEVIEVVKEVPVEVIPADYEETKRRVRDLEHIEKIHREDNQGLRKQLAEKTDELMKARDILKINENVRDIRRDVTYLVQATNSYVRQYGGLTWTLQQLSEVDEPTLEQLRKAARNLATFASALVSNLEAIEGK